MSELEEFLAENGWRKVGQKRPCIYLDDLREFMAGKVLVPVSVLHYRWAAENIAVPVDVRGAKATEMFWRGVYEYQNLMAAVVKEEK